MIRFSVRCSLHEEGKYEVYCYIDGDIFYSTSRYDEEDAKQMCSRLNRGMNRDQEEICSLKEALITISRIAGEATND